MATQSTKELASSIVAAVRIPLVVLDPALQIVAVNRSFELLVGTTPEDLTGQAFPALAAKRLASPRLRDMLEELLTRSRAIDDHEIRLTIPHLGDRALLLGARLLDLGDDSGSHVLLSLEDTSVRQLAEQRLMAERSELQLALEERISELASAAQALVEERSAHERTTAMLRHADRLAAVGRLGASVIHELGTPLNVVSARAKMIERDVDSSGPTVRNARIIGEQAERMAALLRRLLDFSRKQQAERHSGDLGALAQATIDVVEPMARKQGVTLVLAPCREAIDVETDATEVQQVMTNLLVNAIDALVGGGTVKVEIGTKRVTRPAHGAAGRFAIISVSDTGPGIEPEDVTQLFEPFFTTKPAGKGTGLGLSVCQSIAVEAGGWIEVRTAPGAGATFLVYLPLAVTP
jgi:PAS domain S-box-containing protein